MKIYVTFGQDHRHEINGIVFDKDCIALVNGTRKTVFGLFGEKFCFNYNCYKDIEKSIPYFQRGIIEVKNE